MYEKELQKLIRKRLHFIEGQLRGIDKMLHENRELHDILIQLLAAESGLRKIIYEHVEHWLRRKMAERISALQEKKYLPRHLRETIDCIRKEFACYTLRQLPKVIYQLERIEKRKGK